MFASQSISLLFVWQGALKAKIPLDGNPNVNNECEWWIWLGDQWRFSSMCCALLCSSPVYEGVSRPIKHLHSHRWLHAVIQFVAFAVRIRIRMNGITPILILCFRFCVCHIRIRHSYCAQVESQLKLTLVCRSGVCYCTPVGTVTQADSIGSYLWFLVNAEKKKWVDCSWHLLCSNNFKTPNLS